MKKLLQNKTACLGLSFKQGMLTKNIELPALYPGFFKSWIIKKLLVCDVFVHYQDNNENCIYSYGFDFLSKIKKEMD